MKKIYVIQDSSGWMSDYYFTSLRKAEDCLRSMTEKSADIYDLPLHLHVFTLY